MTVMQNILLNAVLLVLLPLVCLLLPMALMPVIIMDSILMTYANLVAMLRSTFCCILSKSIHCMIVPAVLLALAMVYWINSQWANIVNLVTACSNILIEELDRMWKVMVNIGANLEVVRAAWNLVKDYNLSFAQTDTETEIEGLNPIRSVARVRGREESRFRRFIDNLEVLEAADLPENMKTEHAILLTLTRTSAADGRGIVHYHLSERHSPSRPVDQPNTCQYEVLQPHSRYYKLHKSEINLFRLDEPDCSICLDPLEVGQAMVTHDTCRRTYHTKCLNTALLKDIVCPFDREHLVFRHDEPEPMPTANPVLNDDGEQGLLIDPPAPGLVVLDIMPAWLQHHQRPAEEIARMQARVDDLNEMLRQAWMVQGAQQFLHLEDAGVIGDRIPGQVHVLQAQPPLQVQPPENRIARDQPPQVVEQQQLQDQAAGRAAAEREFHERLEQIQAPNNGAPQD